MSIYQLSNAKTKIMEWVHLTYSTLEKVYKWARRRLPYLTCLRQRRRTRHQAMVLEFNEMVGNYIPIVPSIATKDVIVSKARLITEEYLELMEAMGISIHTGSGESFINMQDISIFPSDYSKTLNLPEIAKELADLHVVVTGTEQAFGINLLPIQEEVDKNNLGKFGVGSYIDEHGKLRKPPNYPKPDIASLLKKQGWTPPNQ